MSPKFAFASCLYVDIDDDKPRDLRFGPKWFQKNFADTSLHIKCSFYDGNLIRKWKKISIKGKTFSIFGNIIKRVGIKKLRKTLGYHLGIFWYVICFLILF